ncbi:5212_t:CDS:1 [Diversispora eburnea]|uniref:5212_t:CDS:1 n=1 Tax=Diversispora eburnea TaxID=1213867 RepID=A0A9N9B3N6_9GLOM|nr:5212_t:CDS:1 [Diversispora eburnea]
MVIKLNTFPLSKLSFDLLVNILSFSIKHEGSKVINSQLIYVCRFFAKAAIPLVWKHLYLQEPTQRKIFKVLQTCLTSPSHKLLFNYQFMVKRVTICPLSISNINGLLQTLELVKNNLPNLSSLNIEDKLSLCHSCHFSKEATTDQLADLLLHFSKNLNELCLDSDHSTFNDELLEVICPRFSNLRKLSINGSNFTEEGILEYVIPNLKNNLIEFSAGRGGISPNCLTGNTVLALLENCYQLKSLSLEGINLSDNDFMGEDLPLSNLEYLWLGKTCEPQNFTERGLFSLLITCNETLTTLVLDLDHLSSFVFHNIIIPLFQDQKLQELHLVSDSWAGWTANYPQPRSEQEFRAKEAMCSWRLKAYSGITNEMINLIGEKLSTLKVFSILGENYLKST